MIIHLNNTLVPQADARVSPFDRGFIFGDGIYEGLRATGGRIIAPERHAQRMRDGLAAARIHSAFPDDMDRLSRELLAANDLDEAFVYWQVTRGVPAPGAPWRERVPHEGMEPTVLGVAVPDTPIDQYTAPRARACVVRPDIRWLRGRVKSISLLGNVLSSIEADEAGADDAILVRDDIVAEATASNVFLSLAGRVVTPALDSTPILAGVTRDLILDRDPTIEQRPVTLDELRAADEIMLVGTRTMVASVVTLDGSPVGKGVPGPHAHALLGALLDAIHADVHLRHA